MRDEVCGIRWTPPRADLDSNPYYDWIVQGLHLYRALERLPVEVIECFPTASWTRWLGPRDGRRRSAWTREGLETLRIEGVPTRTSQDARDAIAAALTARDYARGRFEAFGEIIVPTAGAGLPHDDPCDDAYVAFVPDDFQPPPGLVADDFLLEPLGPEHNEDDYEAWTSSIEHIRATPGFRGGRWPHAMTLEENRADLERHARDFAARSGFTYTVLDASHRGVIGCVYIYPDKGGVHDAVVTSWVRATHAGRDAALRKVVSRWLDEAWPFERVSYDGPA